MSDKAAAACLPDDLTFETRVTLEDQLALQMRCLATPAIRAGRLRREAIAVLVAGACAPFALAIGVLIAWAGDRHASSFGAVLRSLVLEEPGFLGMAVLVMAACTLGGVVVQRWRARPRMRSLLRRVLRARPDVDPSDPHLAYRACVTVSDAGVESRTAVGSTFLRWGVLKRWEEAGEHIMVLGDAMVGFCLRTSAADPGPLDRFRTILTARLGPNKRPME